MDLGLDLCDLQQVTYLSKPQLSYLGLGGNGTNLMGCGNVKHSARQVRFLSGSSMLTRPVLLRGGQMAILISTPSCSPASA